MSDLPALLSVLETIAAQPQSFDYVTLSHWANKAKCELESLQRERDELKREITELKEKNKELRGPW